MIVQILVPVALKRMPSHPSLIESVEWVKYNNSKNEESVRTNLGILLKDKSDQKKYIERLEESNELNEE